jgi:hypothetical protein
LGSSQKLYSFQRKVAKAVEAAKSAKVQKGIREMIREIMRTIGKGMMCGSALIASGEGISPRTARASNTAILLRLPTLHQNHRLRLL